MSNSLIPGVKILKNSLPLVLNYTLFSVMMAFFTILLVKLGQAAVPAWNGNYLVIAGFLITLEALLARKIISSRIPFSLEWILQIISEAGMFFLTLKACQIVGRLVSGQPLPSELIDGDLAFSLVYAVFLWFITFMFGNLLSQLEENPETIEQQKAGQVESNMEATRKKLIGYIFGLGAVMLCIYTFLRLDITSLVGVRKDLQNSPWPIIAFFIVGFMIISQTRYASLRIRWYMDNVAIGPHFGPGWLFYSLVLLLLVGLVSLVLPTRYSLGLLATLQTLLTYLFSIAMAIFIGIAAPLGIVFGWLQSLFGNVSTDIPPIQPTTPVRTPQPPQQPVSIPDWIQSFAFWGILIAVSAFSVIYYLRSHKEYTDVLTRSRFTIWFASLWRWLRRWFKRLNKGIVRTVNQGFRRLRSHPITESLSGWKVPFITSRVDNRQKVRLIYLQLVDLAGKTGFHRKKSFTPRQYSRRLVKEVPEVEHQIQVITEDFSQARYTTHPVNNDQVDRSQSALSQVQAALKRKLESDHSNIDS
jgi:hypothetical protein